MSTRRLYKILQYSVLYILRYIIIGNIPKINIGYILAKRQETSECFVALPLNKHVFVLYLKKDGGIKWKFC